ncbi:MAG: DUF4921 family protein [Actinobacteria bacterium]|nr:DUF4921 family protein [Actinomycetota bacterium]
MPELRRNPLSDQWVVVAPERAQRPETFRPPSGSAAGNGVGGVPESCPFCPGNESMTPPEVARTGEGQPDSPGWRIRVVPNLYPIVRGDPARIPPGSARFHDALRGGGAHEVAVLSPDHDRSLADLTGVEVEELFEVMTARVRRHREHGFTYTQVLVNFGKPAGASIEHPHAQLVAISVPPPAVVVEARNITAARECHVCRAVAEDADHGAPLFVAESPAPVWCPWWSGVPFEVMIAPRGHEPRFEHSADLGNVARSVVHALALIRGAVGEVAYNLVVHSSPFGDGPGVEGAAPGGRDFHWHVHVWPRIVIQAGFEYGTGILVNQVPPEYAAASLRAAGRGGEAPA